jgi:hypothetical protein
MNMTAPKKNTAWNQGLYAVSSTKKECLGALRETQDGRKFRYAKAGATLIAGGACYCKAYTANHVAQVQTGVTNAVGSTEVKMLVGGTAVTANQYDDGYLVIYDTTSGRAGNYYPISSHETSAAGTEIIRFRLKEPLQVATYATCYFSLYENPWNYVVSATDIAVAYAGQAMYPATVGQYLWLQTGGFSVAYGGDTSAVGMSLSPSDTTYALETASGYTGPFVGFVYGGALVSTKFTAVVLTSD